MRNLSEEMLKINENFAQTDDFFIGLFRASKKKRKFFKLVIYSRNFTEKVKLFAIL